MKHRILIYSLIGFALVAAWYFLKRDTGDSDFTETVKLSLREVGDELLKAYQDSTSRVMPVKQLESDLFELSFEKDLSIFPGTVIQAADSSFAKNELPKAYRVEIIQCSDGEVAYSYEMNSGVEKTLIPCLSRSLPEACYTARLRFIELPPLKAGFNPWWLLLIFLLTIPMVELILRRRRAISDSDTASEPFSTLGSFKFYPEQNKLIKEAVEIPLSNKEAELLAIFAANPNKVIKRDELTKRVWEDNGVIVGRSLDTYISKLRKKLQDDERIRISNVHGVGYRLDLEA